MNGRIRSTSAIATIAAGAPRRAMQQMLGSVVPALADFAVVFVVAGRSIVSVASAHVSPSGERLLRELHRVYRIHRDDLQSTVAQVVRTGRPLLRRAIHSERPPTRPRGSVADLHRRLACRSALVIPLWANRTVTGVLSLCYAGSGRAYVLADLSAARRIARQFARWAPPQLPDAASRLRPAIGDTRRHATVRRRVAARN